MERFTVGGNGPSPGGIHSLKRDINMYLRGRLDGSAVEHLPSAQGVILGFRDRVPHRAPCKEPDVGLDPRTPGSQPELKQTLNC